MNNELLSMAANTALLCGNENDMLRLIKEIAEAKSQLSKEFTMFDNLQIKLRGP